MKTPEQITVETGTLDNATEAAKTVIVHRVRSEGLVTLSVGQKKFVNFFLSDSRRAATRGAQPIRYNKPIDVI
jgi:hypothetical protein